MKMLSQLVAILAFCSVVASRTSDHPVVKVINLLKELTQKVKDEGRAEEETYGKFQAWCSASFKTLDKAIMEGKDSIDVLKTTISAKKKKAATLEKQIETLTSEITKQEQAGESAADIRKEAADLYTQSDADLESTIAAFTDAIAGLEDASKTDGLFFVQKITKLPLVLEQLTDSQKAILLQGDPTYESMFGKNAVPDKKYNFKSNNIIELLKTLKTKFKDDRVAGTKGETASQNAYDLEKDARDAALEAANSAKDEKTTLLGETEADIAEAEGELKDTEDALAADEENLSDTKKQCSMKASEWSERLKIRMDEIKAMGVAVEILAKVTGVRSEAPENPMPPTSPLDASALAQLNLRKVVSVALSVSMSPKEQAVNLLRQEAKSAHSRQLAQFADEVAAHLTGPFDELNNMIQKMIFRLMDEQKNEDEHKNWCDLETSKTNTSIDDKDEKIKTLKLKIEAGKAKTQQLSDDITEASEMVATLEKHIKESTEIRQTGHKENKEAIADAKSAQQALSKAMGVLEAHYKESGMVEKEAWELLQKKSAGPVELPENPASWDSGYTGVSDPSKPGGIITMLKEVSADFTKMQADTEAQEETDKMAYDKEMQSCDIEKAGRAKEAEMKEQEKKRTVDKVDSMAKALKHVSGELDATEQYYKDLGPACRDGDSSYDARKEARSEEIGALKEAQVILADAFKEKEASFLQTPSKKRSLRAPKSLI